MKNKLLTLFLCAFGMASIHAQEWQTDYDTAIKEASEKDQSVVLVFQGSDWCAPCIKLDKAIFQTETFQKYAEDHFVMLKADFPRKKKNALPKEQKEKNRTLADTYNPQGIFPFVVILNSNGTVLGETGYLKISPDDYISHLESFKK